MTNHETLRADRDRLAARVAELERINTALQELTDQFEQLQGITALHAHVEFGEHVSGKFTVACPTSLDADMAERAQSIMQGIYDAIAEVAGGLQARRIAELEAALAVVVGWVDMFDAETTALPNQHENKSKGQCTYNWHSPICRELLQLVQPYRALLTPTEEAQDG